MSQITLSPKTVKALAEVVTGGPGAGFNQHPPIGIYRGATEIEEFMMDCNIDFRLQGGSRVPLVLGYLRQLAGGDPEDIEKLSRIILRTAESDDYVNQPERQQAVIDHLNRFLSQDGLEIIIRGNRPHLVEAGRSGAIIGAIVAKVAIIDFDTVQRDVDRALRSAEDDPEDAVTAACSIIESVCRSILIELKLELPPKKDIDGLVKAVQEPLGLSPGRSDLPIEIAADVRQVLGGLTTTAKGIGSLRTHAGDAHGRERGFKRVDGRIARLATHAASTLALFLIETWERKQRRPLPQAAQ